MTRFWSRVDRGDVADCWLWRGYLNNGYGQVKMHGQLFYAHRVAFETEREPIPAGLTLDHLCRTPACVNPTHLEPVTLAENLRRMRAATDPDPETRETCANGHPWGDLYRTPSGVLHCRPCRREAQARSDARRRLPGRRVPADLALRPRGRRVRA